MDTPTTSNFIEERTFKNFTLKTRDTDWVKERYYILKQDLGVFFREQKIKPNSFHTDCIPNFWLYCSTEFKGEISYIRNNKEYQLWGPKSIFIPPFSIINWKFNSYYLKWKAFEGTSHLPLYLPNIAIIFNSNNFSFCNEQEIFKHILNNKKDWTEINAQHKISSVALKVKNYIDSHFLLNFKVSDIASHLNISIDVMTRQFKKMYKITPSTYIRDLKFYQAALHITESNEPIKKIAHSVGISNYEHFSKMFRVVFNANPKSFREKPF